MSEPLLRLRSISKAYDGNPVLKDVTFDLHAGEILGLVGENGAGKSTLMNILFGMTVIAETGGFEGEILLEGQPIAFKAPSEALEAGIGMVHQEFSLIPGFTVAENITLNRESTNRSLVSRLFGKKYETMDVQKNTARGEESLGTLEVDIDSKETVAKMPVGHMQFIEIAREMSRDKVKLLIMDEPTAVLTESEATVLLKAMRRIADLGIGIIFITHRLHEIETVSDKVVVLRDGEVVGDSPTHQMSITEMARLMVGHSSVKREGAKRKAPLSDDVVLSVEHLAVDMPGERVRDVNLRVRKGEILGIAGLAGQGKLGIPNGILGTYPVRGEVVYEGEKLPLGNTKKILSKGLGFVSEDRKNVGLLLDEPLDWNIAFNAMQVQGKYLKKRLGVSFRDEVAMRATCEKYIDELHIKTTGPDQKARNLSGGNQQKVCLAKAFAMEPNCLFVSEPTRGIDVGAKELVLEALRKANREQNTTMVVVSSELEELRSLCDRIAVVCEGEIAGILPPEEAPEKFALLMSGVAVEGAEA